VSGAAKPSSSAGSNLAAEFGAVGSVDTLVLALDTIAVRSRYDSPNPDDQRRKIGYLEEQFAQRWRDKGNVAEAFARAWAEVGFPVPAIAWYQRALEASDGAASMKATEQLGNLRARVALEMVEKADAQVTRIETKGKRGAADDLDAARKTRRRFLTKARKELDQARSLLEPLADHWPSIERLSLCGSAWKRRAMIERIAGDSKAEHEALARMKEWYERAERRAIEQKDDGLHYPALNRMAAELLVDAKTRGWSGFEPSALEALRTNLDTKTRTDPDFWSVVGRTELRLYEALARGALATERAGIQAEYDDLWARVSALGDWDSVYVQLRFVLPRYAERAPDAERAAATALLEYVRRLVVRAKRAKQAS
jgi:hypothetical protein